jgi:hypothetical protein
LHDAYEPQVGVDVDDRAVGGARERDVRITLAVIVEWVREPVVILLRRLEHDALEGSTGGKMRVS